MKKYYLLILLVATMLSTGCTKPRFSVIDKQNIIEEPIFTGEDENFNPGENDNNTFPPGEEDDDTTPPGDNNSPPGEDDDTTPPSDNDNDPNQPGDDNNNDNDNNDDDNNDNDTTPPGDNNIPPGEDDDDTNPPGDDNDDNIPPGEDDDVPPGEQDLIETPVDLLCSDAQTRRVGYNLKSSHRLELQIIDEYGNVICRDSRLDLKTIIVNDKILPLEICEQATGLEYAVRLIDTMQTDNIKFKTNGKVRKFDDLLNFSLQSVIITRESTSESFKVINDRNYRKKIEVLYAGNKDNNGDALCDRRASPLVIKTDKNDRGGIKLTSQRRGVFFDILGENSFPFAHAKKRISWISKPSYMFLVKPNAYGQVRGINEMFGDNTKGPDGLFADDGYAALEKYDLNQDKVIDAADPVFSKLMLWSDKNLDGRAQRRELISLEEAGLVAIDLLYDASYSETDQYGNQINMKSVVRYSDGTLRSIFDLWFNYIDKRQSRRR